MPKNSSKNLSSRASGSKDGANGMSSALSREERIVAYRKKTGARKDKGGKGEHTGPHVRGLGAQSRWKPWNEFLMQYGACTGWTASVASDGVTTLHESEANMETMLPETLKHGCSAYFLPRQVSPVTADTKIDDYQGWLLVHETGDDASHGRIWYCPSRASHQQLSEGPNAGTHALTMTSTNSRIKDPQKTYYLPTVPVAHALEGEPKLKFWTLCEPTSEKQDTEHSNVTDAGSTQTASGRSAELSTSQGSERIQELLARFRGGGGQDSG